MDEPALLVAWERTVGLIMDRTGAFPRSSRFTFAARMEGRALDILENLAAARFSVGEEKAALLKSADQHLGVLRVLLRLSYDRRLLDHGALEQVSLAVDEAGRMLGKWRTSLAARKG